MKRNIALWLMVLMTWLASNSCVDRFSVGDGFLEKQPGVDMTIDSIFAKAEYARYFLWESYRGMHCAFNDAFSLNSVTIDALSDCWHSVMGWDFACMYYYSGTLQASPNDWMDRYKYYNANPGTAGGKIYGVWYTTRTCWQFIENVDRVPDMTDSEKERLKAEAKIIIATRYFDMFRHMGGMPIVRHSYTVEDDYMNPRATVEETVNFMIELLDEAAATPDLPWRISESENDTWAGRLTRASAMALKAKILLFAASPLFNSDEPYCLDAPQDAVEKKQVWYGGYNAALWNDCLKACEDFFLENAKNGNYYQLVQADGDTEYSYRMAYRKAYLNRGNSEKLIEVHDRYQSNEWGQQMPGVVSHMGAFSPTVEFMEMFPWANGKNFDGQKIYNTENENNIDIFESRDPRLYENIVVQKKGFTWQGKQVEIWMGGSMYTNPNLGDVFVGNGFPLYKWIFDYWEMTKEPFQWPYLRMGEMHLIYAEALAETGNLTKAVEEVNKVRSRVGLPGIEKANPELNLTSDKDRLITEIMRERACELGMEDVRFHDMVRRKLIADFTKPLHGMRIWRKDGKNTSLTEGEAYPTFRYEHYQITKFARVWWKEGGWSNKWFLKTIPTDEINKDYGLTQNPGW